MAPQISQEPPMICHNPQGEEVECAGTGNNNVNVNPATTGVSQPLQTLDMQATGSGDGGAVAEITPASTQVAVLTIQSVTPTATTVVGEAGSNGDGGGSSLSTGAIAGIAVATAVAGAAIALLVAFLLFKRKVRRNNSTTNEKFDSGSYSDSAPELMGLQKSSGRRSTYVQVSQTAAPSSPQRALFADSATAIPSPISHHKKTLDLADLSGSSDFLASVLPPAADEQTVANKVAAVFCLVQRHVETFYRDVHASITPSMEPDLARFSGGEMDMVELLREASCPTTAIQHALAAYILGITSPPSGDGGETLFPAEIVGVNGSLDTHDSNFTAATLLHRTLTTHLYLSTHNPSSPHLTSTIREAAETFSLTFFPWANPTFSDQEKDEDLVSIIASLLDVRIWLFGQPFLYEFIWEGVGRRGIVVKPGLVRASDEMGRVLGGGNGNGEKRVVLESVVVAT